MSRIKIVKQNTKSPFTPTKVPGAKYVINQYLGCQHACKYCYAKFLCRFYRYGKWGEWIIVRENLPNSVKGKYIKGKVLMSTISDSYQPIERKLKLTRRI